MGGAGLGTWQKTPIEKAIRIAVQQAVRELASKTPPAYFRHGAETKVSSRNSSKAEPQGSVVTSKQTGKELLKVSSTATNASVLPSAIKVKARSANLRDAPGTQGKVVATMKQGAKLSVQAEENGSFFVQTGDAKEGWISKSLTMQ